MSNQLPNTMTEIIIREPGGPEVLVPRDSPLPAPLPNEVLVRVEAAGINRPDILQRLGAYPMPKGANPTPGLEVAGTVAAVGDDVTDFKVGDAVCALTNGGGYAEYCVVPATQVLPVPKGLTSVEAAALPETFFTVWANLFQMGHLQPNESVLIHGGTSGIGSTALMLCKALGITAYATVGGKDKFAFVEQLGGIPIDHKVEDFVESVHHHSNGTDVNVVLDIIGGRYFNRNLQVLRKDGRLVIIGFMGGAYAERADLSALVMKRLHVTGSTMRARSDEEKAAIAQALRQEVWPLLESGACPPPHIHKVFPLKDAADAHKEMEGGKHIGKIVLEVSASDA